MGILKIYDNYQSRKIVLCPKCKGEKSISVYNEKYSLFEKKTCDLCGGQGMMYRVVKIDFKKIEDATKAGK